MNDVGEICEWILRHANAIAVALLGRDGQPIAYAGAEPLGDDAIEAALRIAASLHEPEREAAAPFANGDGSHLHVSLIGERAILAIHFDARSSWGLIRLRVSKARHDLARALARGPDGGAAPAAARLSRVVVRS